MTKQDLKFALTHGGVIKDSQGKWMMHGDKVIYKDSDEKERRGCISFCPHSCSWYVHDSETKEVWYLGREWEEVTFIEKV